MGEHDRLFELSTWTTLVELKEELSNTLGVTQGTFGVGALDAVSWFSEAQQFLEDIEEYLEENPPHDIEIGDIIEIDMPILKKIYGELLPTDLKQHLDNHTDGYEVVLIQEHSVIIHGYYRIPLKAIKLQ